ncbi:MAG: hypothetical protein RMZ69_35050 [Nostoc sp. ChiQUE01a]|nr:hypothetical protein [Nostoc sp. ChiQUE01a]
MKYRIEISSVAESEADKAFLRLSQITSPSKASQWYAQLLHRSPRVMMTKDGT